MEQNGSDSNIPAAAVSSLCRMGCGFYGNQSFEGMCSKCYKDALKRKQQSSSPTPNPAAGRISPIVHPDMTGASVPDSVCKPMASNSTTPSVDTATTTIPTPSVVSSSSAASSAAAKEHDKEEASGGTSTSVSTDDSSQQDGEKEKRPKKNRCHTCKKKVGLTGFQCRCGGLYCSMHRYSDKHDCSFNYKEMAQEQIRKNNPVIVSEKIQKI